MSKRRTSFPAPASPATKARTNPDPAPQQPQLTLEVIERSITASALKLGDIIRQQQVTIAQLQEKITGLEKLIGNVNQQKQGV